jgi:hypothetical protein
MSRITGYWKRHLRPAVLDTVRRFGGVPVPADTTTAGEWAAAQGGRLISLPADDVDEVPARTIVGNLAEIEKTKAMIPDPAVRAEYERLLHGASRQRCDEFVALLDRGRICHNSGLVITPDNRVLFDASRLTPESDLPTNPLRLRYLPRPRQRTECVAALSCVMPYNYYHWLLEAIPRIALYERAGVRVDRYYAPTRYAFQRDLLALAGIPRGRIEQASVNGHVVADQLAASSLRLNATRWKTDFLFSRLTAHLDAAAPPTRRVFISRRKRGKRTLTNDAAVFAALAPLGFRRYDLEAMPVAEQIRLFFQAACVVGPHGAGLTNLTFCRPGTKVVEINTPYRTTTCFSDIAHHRRLDYRLHVATPVHEGFFHFQPQAGVGDSNLFVEPDSFAASIADFLAAASPADRRAA